VALQNLFSGNIFCRIFLKNFSLGCSLAPNTDNGFVSNVLRALATNLVNKNGIENLLGFSEVGEG
jgi:hypothetical protein|tara:strand:- start:99 stop:293 length:195 start_codon:yes stop_codon:yes gene_type:complete